MTNRALEFDGRDNDDDPRVVRESDVSLKRDVVVVRGVTSMRFRHVFPNVGAGRSE